MREILPPCMGDGERDYKAVTKPASPGPAVRAIQSRLKRSHDRRAGDTRDSHTGGAPSTRREQGTRIQDALALLICAARTTRHARATCGLNAMNTFLNFVNDLARAWRMRAAQREFQRLDAATMRDLGISPSEFGSYWAEREGLVERTRRRIEPY